MVVQLFHTTVLYFLVSFTNLQVPMMLGLAFAYVSTGFTAAIVKEKENRAKHQQFVMGVRPLIYWSSNLLVDACVYLMPVIIFFILFAACGYAQITGPNFVAAALLFSGAIFAVLAFSYLLSFALDKAVTAQQYGLAINAILGLVLAGGCIALQYVLSNNSGGALSDYAYLGSLLPPLIPTGSGTIGMGLFYVFLVPRPRRLSLPLLD